MTKQTLNLVLFVRTLKRYCSRVFVVFGFTLLLLPLFSYTRALLPASLTRLGLGTQTAYAVTSDNLNFQARLETSAGAIAADGYYNIRFKLYDALTGGTLLWTETYYDSNGVTAGNDNRVRVANGYVSVNLGSQTSFPSTIPWDQQLYLTMDVGGTTQTATPTWDGEMSPRLSLTAVPYAFSAKTASELTTYNSVSGFTSNLSIQAPTGGNQIFQIPDQGAGGTYTLLTGSAANGSYIQNQSSTDQSASFRISGSGQVNTFLANTTVTVGSASTQGQMVLHAGNGFTTTLKAGASSANRTIIFPATAGSNGDCVLTDGAGQLSFGSCSGGAGSGVTTVGTIDSQTKSSDGAVISGTAIYMQTAQVDKPGLVGTAAQTFAGNKTFQDGVTFASANTAYDRLLIAAANAGSSRFDGTITNKDLTATRTWSLPDASGTIAVSASGNIALDSTTGNITFTGTLPIANGGTNNSAAIGGAGSIVYSDGTKYVYGGTTATAGQCLLSGTSGTGQPTWGTCPASSIGGAGVTITSAAANQMLVYNGTNWVNGTSAGDLTNSVSGNTNTFTIANSAVTSVKILDGTIATGDISTGGVTSTNILDGTIANGDLSTGTFSNITGTGTLTAGAINWSGAITTTAAIQGGTVTTAGFTNTGYSLFTPPATIPDDVNGGNIGASAAATVDVATTLNLNQTTTGQTMTLFSPTTTTAGRVIYINNVGTATFTLYGVSIAAAKSQAYIWNGTAWAPLSVDGAGSGVTTVGTFSGSSQTNGASIAGNTITFGPADATNPGMVTTGTQTFAGLKTFSGGITSTSINTTAGTNTTIGNATGTFSLVSSNINISSAGAITGATGITSSGTITFSGLSTAGIVTNNASGVLGTVSSVPVANGGTNATSIGTAGSVAYSTGTAYAFSAAGTSGQCLTSGGTGAPTWTTCTGAGSGNSLQTAYGNSVGGTTPEITLDATRTTLDIQAYSGQTADLLNLRAYSAVGLGSVLFGVSNTGAVTLAGGLTVTGGGAAITGNSTISGTLTGLTGLASSGTVQFSALGTGVVLSNGSGQLSNGTVNLASGSYVSGTLGVANGGTGLTSAGTAGTLVYSNGSAFANTAQGTSGQCLISNGSGAPTWTSCASAAGVGSYINNQTTNQTGANFNVTSGATTSVTGTIRALASQTADLLQFQTSAGAAFSGVNNAGNWYYANSGFKSTLQTAALTGNQTITLPNATGTVITTGNLSSITATGTITSGAWNGTTVGIAYGGTGNTTYTTNGVNFYDGTKIASTAAGTTGQCLVGTTGSAPTWQSCSTAAGTPTTLAGDVTGALGSNTVSKLQNQTLTLGAAVTGNFLQYNGTAWVNQSLSGDLTVTGAGVATIAAGAVTGTKIANNTITNANLASGSYGNITAVGTLTSLTVSGAASTGALTASSITDSGLTTAGVVLNNASGLLSTSATLPVSYGGTGVNGASAANGQLLIGNGTGYTLAALTQGSNISITNGAGSITIATSLTPSFTSGTFSGASSLTLGTASTNSGAILFNNSGSTNAVTLISAAQASGSYSLNIPVLTGNADICTSLGNCATASGSNYYIQNQNSTDQVANFRIDGTGQANSFTAQTVTGNTVNATTAVVSPVLRPQSDGTTAFQIQNAAGTQTMLNVDTTNLAVSLANVATAQQLSVNDWRTGSTLSGKSQAYWRSITSSADGTKLAAVVNGGSIYTSTDSGATWTERTSAGSRNWYSITSSADGTKLAAAAYGGSIYTSTDSGATWTERTSAGSRDWWSITSSADGTKLAAVVNGGSIYTSTDSGATWTERTSAGSRDWYSITSSADGTKLAAVVNGGSIYTSTDSGATWTERTSAGSRYWQSITSSADGTKLAAAAYGGSIYTSADSGATWTERTSAGSRSWLSITSNSDGTKLAAVVYGGSIYTSTDSGATWTERTSAGSRDWYSITSSADGTKLAAVVNGGSIYTSTDSGATWTQRTSAGSRNWQSITSSADGTKLAAVVNGGSIYTSTDSGATWTQRTSAGSRSWASITSSADGTKLAAVVNGGSIYTSTDSGATWTERTSAGSRYWQSITSNSDGTKLAAVVYGGSIYTSTDSGATWTERTSAGSRSWLSITSNSDGTKLAAVVYGGSIYTSTDSGATWTERTSAGSRNWYSITSSADGTKLAAVVYGGSIYTSTDSGATWTERTSAGSRSWASITSSADGTKLAAVVYYGYIYTSADSGATWTERTSAGSRDWWSITSSADGTKLAAAVSGGKIYTLYTGPQLTVAGNGSFTGNLSTSGSLQASSVVTDSLFAAGTTVLAGLTQVNLSADTGTNLICQNSNNQLSVCDSSIQAPTAANFVQNQSTSAQTGNIWINGTARADTAVITPTIRPAADGTTAFQIQNASSAAIFNVDTTNSAIDITGSLALKRGSDFTTTGTSNDVNFGNVSLVRLNGSSAQTITGIANGRDGYMLTIVNAANQTATIANSSTSSVAANRIITGTGADVSLVAGGSAELVYDSGSSVWRIVGAVTSGGVPMAKTYRTSDQTLTTSTWTAVAFNAEAFDNNAIHDTVTNNTRLTAATAGTYKINAQTVFSSVSGSGVARSSYVRLNGSTQLTYDNPAPRAAGNSTLNHNIVTFYMSVGDYIELMAFQDSGANLNLTSGTANTFMEMYRIDGGFTSFAGGINTMGILDGGTANSTGATISGSTIFLQSASFTQPGLVNTTTQTFTGDKTFKSTTNSSTAFQIQDSSSAGILKVSTDSSTYGLYLDGNANNNTAGSATFTNANDGVAAGSILQFVSGTTNAASGYIGAFSNAHTTYLPYQDALAISTNTAASGGIVIRDSNTTGKVGFYMGNNTTPHIQITNSAWYSGYTNTIKIAGSAGSASCGSIGCPVIALNTSGPAGSRWGIGVENGGSITFSTENGTAATIRMTLSNTASLTVAGTSACTIGSGTGATNCTSDARLKNIQGTAGGNLSKIMQLQPEYYTWKSDNTQTTRMGLIAQDVQAVLPEFVVTGQDGFLQLDYGGLVAPIIGAIHEQQAQIDTLSSAVSSLQSATLVNGGTVNGNITINGGLSVSGDVTVTGKVSTGDIYVNGHIATRGAAPTVAVGAALGQGVLGIATTNPVASIDGTDGAGTVNVTAGAQNVTTGVLAHISFAKAFDTSYKVVVSAGNDQASQLRLYVTKTATGFDIVSHDPVTAGTQYSVDYIVLGATNQ